MLLKKGSFFPTLLLTLASSITIQFVAGKPVEAQSQEEIADRMELLQLQLSEAQLRVQESQARLNELQIERQIRTLELPSVDRNQLRSGSTTLDTTSPPQIEIHTLAYEAIGVISQELYEDIIGLPNVSSIIIFDDSLEASLSAYRSYKTQFSLFRSAYSQVVDPDESGLFDLIDYPTAIAEGVANFLSLFRTDTTIQAERITDLGEDTALVAQLAARFRENHGAPLDAITTENGDNNVDNDSDPPRPRPVGESEPKCQEELPSSGIGVYYPSLFPVALIARERAYLGINYSSACEYEVLKDLEDLFELKTKADEILRGLEGIDENELTNQDKRTIQQITSLNESYSKFIGELFTTIPEKGISPLAVIVSMTKLETLLDSGGEGAHLLYFEVTAGGNNRVQNNWFTGSRLSHSGGTILSYMIFDADGFIKLSGTHYYHTGYQRLEGPTSLDD